MKYSESIKNSKLTVNVAIAAYNAEKNIKRLTESMLAQKEISYDLKEIIVNSDSSTDKTVPIAQSIKDKRVHVIDSNARAGFAGALISLVKANAADVLVLLNDDIIITDTLFLEKTVQAFIKEKNVGLVCCNPQAFQSKNFISEAVRSGFKAYKKMAMRIRNGNNVHTCDGKSLCFSKDFAESINFPKDLREMGNVDRYLYYLCLKNKFKYRYVDSAIMYFKCPSTIKDFIKWQTRNYKSSNYIVKHAFGKLTDKEDRIPATVFRYYKFIEFLKNPLGSIFILGVGQYCIYKARQAKNEFEMTWDLVQTTKDL